MNIVKRVSFPSLAVLGALAVALGASPDAAAQATFQDIGADIPALVGLMAAALAGVVIACVTAWSGFHLARVSVKAVIGYLSRP